MRLASCLRSLTALAALPIVIACTAAPPAPDASPDAAVVGDDAAVETDGGPISTDAGLDGAVIATDAEVAIDAQVVDASVAPSCLGTAPSCFGRDAPGCEIGLGCAMTFRCIGFAARCIEQGTDADCAAVTGCTWNNTTGRCGGAQRQCTTFDDADTCWGQPGCVDGSACTGTITPCGGLDETTCWTQLGCAWGTLPAT